MRLSDRTSGFSLVEVMVAGVVFSIAVVGVYASLANVKEQSMKISDKGLGAALCGQQFLENMRAAVDQRDWGTGQLALTAWTNGTTCYQTSTLANGSTVNTAYSINYQIADGGAGATSGLSRKATVIVSWP